MDQWSDKTLRAWFFAVCAGVVLTGIWFNIEPYACPVPPALLSGENPPRPQCFEFWFNRYQALIAATIAGAIAFWAGRLLLRQTSATEKQVAAQRYDFLRDRIS